MEDAEEPDADPEESASSAEEEEAEGHEELQDVRVAEDASSDVASDDYVDEGASLEDSARAGLS